MVITLCWNDVSEWKETSPATVMRYGNQIQVKFVALNLSQVITNSHR